MNRFAQARISVLALAFLMAVWSAAWLASPAAAWAQEEARPSSLEVATPSSAAETLPADEAVQGASASYQVSVDGSLDASKSNGETAGEAGTDLVGVRYSVNVQNGSWTTTGANGSTVGTAKSKQRVTDLKVALDTGTSTGSVKYRMRRASGKWTGWQSNGAELGARDNIEAIQIKLTGSISKTYDIVYSAYVQDVGWQRRMRNGESAGVEGANKRIEAIRVYLEDKNARDGWISTGGTWSFYQKGTPLANSWLDTKESPIDSAAKSEKRYWLDTDGVLAVNRFVIPNTGPDAAASYAAFASESGYLATGKHVGSDGVITLSDDEGRLYTATQWLKTDKFDGTAERYRLKNVGAYAVVQTGLFKVAGKKYYGYEDGRGYVMRSTTRWAAGKWYKANKNGVLKNVNKKTKKHVNRYVKWAVKTARDNSHGYSQETRWGPDYDCSSLVVSALNAAGFPDSGALWTGNMKKCLKKIGFVWHKGTKGLRRGDILLVHASYRQHTEIYLGKNRLVGAHSSENGGIYGTAGDQTGNEISIVKYYNAPWQGYLRYRS